ncbi:MAG TPA: nucleotidyltransferase [Sulfurospirillum sp. UBA11407]|jgi:predicted nucleotidyltransferase|nr:MAG TPA: nucleotidyltransferase [Sulfurospirillum sp. UBA11407]DAB33215.1 MAG TPA: nucleotidyltransferase [Sulfurospirillum sp. UBA12182]
MLDKEQILKILQKMKFAYAQEGITIIGLFGSYAKETQDKYSDIDIAYEVDYETFTKRYQGGFAKLLKIDSIKKELETIFKKNVDFIPNNNKKVLKDIIYV